jgi:hypothetical protein
MSAKRQLRDGRLDRFLGHGRYDNQSRLSEVELPGRGILHLLRQPNRVVGGDRLLPQVGAVDGAAPPSRCRLVARLRRRAYWHRRQLSTCDS